MTSRNENIVKHTQEQTVAECIKQINLIRFLERNRRLDLSDKSCRNAFKEINKLKQFVSEPEHILGSATSKHGEIAEHMQVDFSNAERIINNKKPLYTFKGVGRTASADYKYKGEGVQSKFYNSPRNTLKAVQEHWDKYSKTDCNVKRYDIPKDQYKEAVRVIKLRETNPSALSKSDIRLLDSIDNLKKDTGMNIGNEVQPSVVEYPDTQLGKAKETINKEEQHLRDIKERNDRKAIRETAPSLKEGAVVAGIGAGIEGGTAFYASVLQKTRNGTSLYEFTAEDWKEVGIDTAKGTVKGAIRGSSVYLLTNFTPVNANVASAYVSAAFAVGGQVCAYRRGELSADELVKTSEALCLDIAVSTISSIAGQALIPIPYLGGMIGSVVGEYMYDICKEYAEADILSAISEYRQETAQLIDRLDTRYAELVKMTQEQMKRFSSLEELAFSKDVNGAFSSSIMLADELGVCNNNVLHNISEIDNYFMQ